MMNSDRYWHRRRCRKCGIALYPNPAEGGRIPEVCDECLRNEEQAREEAAALELEEQIGELVAAMDANGDLPPHGQQNGQRCECDRCEEWIERSRELDAEHDRLRETDPALFDELWAEAMSQSALVGEEKHHDLRDSLAA